MDLRRILKHLFMTHWQVRRAFPSPSLAAIERTIQDVEASHVGQIHFALEGALHGAQLIHGLTARDLALEVFAQLRVWDTEHNNGVMIYLLLADRDVEIVADRGIHAKTGDGTWHRISRTMEASFAQQRFEEGVIGGVRAVEQELAKHFPASGPDPNELPNRPTVL
jgi:uncharacterized membrane protein